MVLAGVMVGSLFSAGTSFIKLVADTNEQLPAITYWLMGALTAVRLDDLHFAMVPILLGLIPLFFLRWRLNLLTISEAEARSMGVNTAHLPSARRTEHPASAAVLDAAGRKLSHAGRRSGAVPHDERNSARHPHGPRRRAAVPLFNCEGRRAGCSLRYPISFFPMARQTY